MTRINVVDVTELTDQHLMAEYRELPMVFTSAKRSNPSKFVPLTDYTLNKGHVTFFFNKKQYLLNRWMDLVMELNKRNYNIDPAQRRVLWNELDKFPQINWTPDKKARQVNIQRLEEKILMKPTWYRYCGKSIDYGNTYKLTV